ncbi:MAG: glycosyltransferase family 4 protein [Candidatus Thermoplasmatota archaeon]|nr:glycosyltransferase family 4 protein [Candidatus Thermoplasmatota archaeon]
MKVAFVKGSFGTPWEAGILEAINKTDVQAKFFVSKKSPAISQELQIEGVNIRGIDVLNRIVNRTIAARGFEFLSGIRLTDYSSYYFRGISRLKDFDVLHLVDESFTVCNQAMRSGVPSVMTIWENIPFSPMWEMKRPARNLRESVFSRVSMFLPVSEVSKKLLSYYGVEDERIQLVHPGIDTEEFSPAPESDRDADSSLNILGISRVEYFKGISFTLRALADLSRTTKDFTYTHIGTGNQRFLRYLRHLAEKLGIERNVKFSGAVSYHDIPGIIRNSNLLVMPSIPSLEWEEQMGFALLEAMSSEVPVIASDHPSIREVVPESCGILVPAGNDESLSKAFLQASLDREKMKSMGKKGREHVIRNYNCRDTAERYVEVYAKVVR